MSKYELTDEQKAIIKTVHNDEKIIKINSVAGSGKSSTLLEIAKEIRKTDKDIKIYYFVFNKLMVEEAKKMFEGLDVQCFTTHSFALRRFTAINKNPIEVIPGLDFNIFMELKNNKKYCKKWIRFKTINELLNQFCLCFDNIDDFCINIYKKPKNYGITDRIVEVEIDFLKDIYNYMISNNIYTHGLYLKCYACDCKDKISTPILLLDECQDTSLMFYGILKRMNYKKLYACGDVKQNIYQFCKTINIFNKIEGKTYPLSVSFRINNKACDLANRVLAHHYKDFKYGDLKNLQNRTKLEDNSKKTILFRYNSSLFIYATQLISQIDGIKVIFMGTDGSSACDNFDECFNDMLYFYYRLIKSQNEEKANEFRSTFNFKANKTVDNYIKIAEKENKNIYHYLYKNKDILSLDFRKYLNFFLLNEIDIIEVVKKVKASEECINPSKTYFLSTAHRYKGLEAEHVKVAPDEWSISSDAECNLTYIAVTRSTKVLEAQPIEDLLLK